MRVMVHMFDILGLAVRVCEDSVSVSGLFYANPEHVISARDTWASIVSDQTPDSADLLSTETCALLMAIVLRYDGPWMSHMDVTMQKFRHYEDIYDGWKMYADDDGLKEDIIKAATEGGMVDWELYQITDDIGTLLSADE